MIQILLSFARIKIQSKKLFIGFTGACLQSINSFTEINFDYGEGFPYFHEIYRLVHIQDAVE